MPHCLLCRISCLHFDNRKASLWKVDISSDNRFYGDLAGNETEDFRVPRDCVRKEIGWE